MNVLSFPRDIERLREFQNQPLPDTFRYFARRVLEDAIATHQYTVLYRDAGRDVGYGHLDRDVESSRIFLGICVLPEAQGRGIGRRIMEELLRRAPGTVYLTVDPTNLRARNLYETCGFEQIGHLGSGILYCRSDRTMSRTRPSNE